MVSFGELIFCSSIFARTFMKAQLYVMKLPMKYHPPIVAFTQLSGKVFCPGYKLKKLSQQILMHFPFSYYLPMSTKRKVSKGVSIEYIFWIDMVFFSPKKMVFNKSQKSTLLCGGQTKWKMQYNMLGQFFPYDWPKSTMELCLDSA